MSCRVRSSLLNLTRSQRGLEDQRNIAIQDITNAVYPYAQVGVSSSDYWIKIITGGTPLRKLLPSETKIVELPAADILTNYQNFPEGCRGLYDYGYGKTILCEGRWCRETLIHETLHSVSFLSVVRPNLRRMLSNLYEGLTEFFAGYVMFCRYPDCYAAWRENLYPICSVTYGPIVKLWAVFCKFIPIGELIKIYFWDGTINWEARYADFLSTIHRSGYPRFGDIFEKRKPTLEICLLQECLKNFGKKRFSDIYYKPMIDCLDFSQIFK